MSQRIWGCHAAVNASMSRCWKPSKAWRTVSALGFSSAGIVQGALRSFVAGGDLDVERFYLKVGDFRGSHRAHEAPKLGEDLGRAGVGRLAPRPVVVAGDIPDERVVPVF